MHLNGLLRGEGSVQVCGLAVEKANIAAIRNRIGLVFQDSESQLFMPTVLEDVAFGLLNRGMSEPEPHGDLSGSIVKASKPVQVIAINPLLSGVPTAVDGNPDHIKE